MTTATKTRKTRKRSQKTIAEIREMPLSEMTKAEEKRYWEDNAMRQLRKFCKPGTTVYTVLHHVSKSGMTRDIGLCVVHKGEIVTISGYVARVLGYKHSDNGGVRTGGCGMDMGFHLVHSLSYAIHGHKDKNVPEEAKSRPFKATRKAYRSGYSLEHRWL